jgi:ABC-type multidrug transport system ATPase subunit
MKVTLKNLGLLKQAEFTLGDLTIICGSNNMGKTYATYALFGFLYFWNELVDLIWNELVDSRLYDIDIDDNKIEEFISNGLVDINLQQIQIDLFEQVINNACNKYTNEFLTKVFASSIDQFKNSLFKIDLNIGNYMISSYNRKALYYSNEEDREVRTIEISFSRENNSMIISLSRDVGVQVDSHWLKITINRIVKNAIQHFAFFNLFPKPFIISSERTGAATFRKELDFARNRLLKNIAHGNRDIKTITSMLQQGYQDYPLPVEQNVEFTRNLEKIVKQRSFISHLYPEILTEFSDMIGGDYQVSGEDILSYVPLKNKRLKLSLNESSSAIRSLLDLGFYLRHQAAVGDLLMIDEPELNLHPDNQRRIARLLARLVNLGIKVFITTHSSYIIKELNTLIMLDRDEPHLKQIAVEENYLESELLSPDKVKVYIAKEALVQLDGQKKKTRSPTLVPAKITPELGIELTSFDTAINTINRIQERIVWGSD